MTCEPPPRRTIIPLLFLLVAVASASRAWAESTLHVDDILGGSCQETWGTFRVTVTNNADRAVSGTLTMESTVEEKHRVYREVSLPAYESVSMLLHAPPAQCRRHFCFTVVGDEDVCIVTGGAWDSWRGDRMAEIMVITDDIGANPIRALGGWRVAWFSALRVRQRDLPERAVALGHLRIIVAERSTVQALSPERRRAIRQWTSTGGELVVVSLGNDRLQSIPLLDELLPSLADDDEAEWPSGIPSHRPRRIRTSYGSRCPAGLGMVHFIAVNEASSGGESIGTAFERLFTRRYVFPTQTWNDVELESASRGELVSDELISAIRARLDANIDESFPVWAYLLIIVLCSGSLFLVVRRWSKGRQGVWRLFATSGIVAIASCVVIYGLAHAARGEGNRYRSMSWIEVASGQTDGALWRRLALATDAPGAHSFVVDNDDLLITTPSAESRQNDGQEVLSITGRRWETVLAAEQGVVELDGAVTIHGGRYAVPFVAQNGLDVPIERAHAVIRGTWYELGRIAPGQRLERHLSTASQRSNMPSFLPDIWTRSNAVSQRNTTALIGEIDMGCPDRGSFRGDDCHTSLVVWRVQ